VVKLRVSKITQADFEGMKKELSAEIAKLVSVSVSRITLVLKKPLVPATATAMSRRLLLQPLNQLDSRGKNAPIDAVIAVLAQAQAQDVVTPSTSGEDSDDQSEIDVSIADAGVQGQSELDAATALSRLQAMPPNELNQQLAPARLTVIKVEPVVEETPPPIVKSAPAPILRASPTSEPTKADTGLSGGTVAGIVVGVLIVAALTVAGVLYVRAQRSAVFVPQAGSLRLRGPSGASDPQTLGDSQLGAC